MSAPVTSSHEFEAAAIVGSMSEDGLERLLRRDIAQAIADAERRGAKKITDQIRAAATAARQEAAAKARDAAGHLREGLYSFGVLSAQEAEALRRIASELEVAGGLR